MNPNELLIIGKGNNGGQNSDNKNHFRNSKDNAKFSQYILSSDHSKNSV